MDPLSLLGIGKFVIDAAPSIASWIWGDKTGKAVEAAKGVVQKVVGSSDPQTIEAKIAADPALALELKKALLAAEAQARADETARIEAVLKDIQSARGSMVDLAKMGSTLAWGAAIVSMLVVVVNGVLGYFIFTGKVPMENRELAMLYVGNLLAALGAVVSFWLGSSMGSVQKTSIAGKQ